MPATPEAPEPTDDDQRNRDDGEAGTLDQPRETDEGDDGVDATVPDA